MNTKNVDLKNSVDNEIFSTHTEFKGFGDFSKESYIYFQDMENTFLDIKGIGDSSVRWVFNKFDWFPEGLYGEVINFYNGEDNYDYEIVGYRRKFLIIGHDLDEMKINIQGQGWTDMKKSDLYKIFKNMLKK